MDDKIFTYNSAKHSYIYHDRGLSFQDANEHCRTSHDGRLVVADNDQTLNDLLAGYRTSNSNSAIYYRIGLKQQNNSLNWIDGSPFFSNSRIERHATGTMEPCKGFAILFQNKSQSELQFSAVNCSYQLAFICQKSTNVGCTAMSVTNSVSASTVNQNFVDITNITTTEAVTDTNTALLAGCVIAACIIFALIGFLLFGKLISREHVNKQSERDTYYSTIPTNDQNLTKAIGSVQPKFEYATIQEIGGQAAADPVHNHSASSTISSLVTYAVIGKNKMTYEDDTSTKPNVLALSVNKLNSQVQPSLDTSEYSSINKQGNFSPSEYDCLALNPRTASPQVTYAVVDRNRLKHKKEAISNSNS